MDLSKLEERLHYYLDCYMVQENASKEQITEFESLTKEMEALLEIPTGSGFDHIYKMASKIINEKQQHQQLEQHRKWLGKFDPQHLANWEKLLKENLDGGKCEMFVRELLENSGNQVEPNVDLTGRRQTPDFRCTQGGSLFYVEVTCLDADRVTGETALAPQGQPSGKAYAFSDLNRAFFDECINKTSQCAGLDQPALVAVGTFHFPASAHCFHKRFAETLLTGTEYVTYQVGKDEPAFLSTKLQRSTFIKPHKETGEITHARDPVSGMLLCGFGCDPPNVQGILHPRPVHEFDRSLLRGIPFVRLQPGYEGGSLGTEWV